MCHQLINFNYTQHSLNDIVWKASYYHALTNDSLYGLYRIVALWGMKHFVWCQIDTTCIHMTLPIALFLHNERLLIAKPIISNMYPNLNRDFSSYGSVYSEQAIVVSSLRKLTQAQMSGCNLASYRVMIKITTIPFSAQDSNHVLGR